VPPQYESYAGRLQFALSRVETRSLDLASVDRSSVTVWHRTDGEWVARETQVVADDDERLVIEASVPQFSYLAVTDTAAPPGTPAGEAGTAATEADSETDTEATGDGIPGFGSGLAVIALIASGLVLAWRQLGRGDDTAGSHGDSSQ
jgi:PGF-CTERM protein